jgi:methylmalonyl-CoA mutase N-terminal domain/subunit
VQKAVNSGLEVNDFGRRVSFFLNSHSNFLEEVAKFRAARRLWAKIMKEKFDASEDACKFRFHTQTAGCTLTAQQAENNIIRVTLQALSSVLGGTQSLHTNSMDEALSLPSEKAAQIALRTQQIIAYESGVTDTVDPLAGSYFIESLTNSLEAEAGKYIDYIEKNGGALWAVESGYYQKEIQRSAYEYQKMVESGEKIIVGVNIFETERARKQTKKLFKVSKKGILEQIKRLKEIKTKRDKKRAKESLDELKSKINTDENLMYPIIECVESYVSIGEICRVLKDAWGEFEQKVII